VPLLLVLRIYNIIICSAQIQACFRFIAPPKSHFHKAIRLAVADYAFEHACNTNIMYGIVVLHFDALLWPLKLNTLVALSKLPVTLYLSLRSVADVNLSVFLTPPRPKSPLNTITLLPLFLSSSMLVTSKSPLNGIRLYFIVSVVDVVLFSIFKVPYIKVDPGV
jgi:hypothetical protein